MKKQVTFVESLKKDKGLKSEGGKAVTRSAEASNGTLNDCEYAPCKQVRDRGTHLSVSAGSSIKPFHFPKCMMTAPFLQHPSLTAGQRRYLYSITNIYSTEQMRRQLKQHYLNVLHSCLQAAFGKAIHALARLGDELWLDPVAKGLALRSVNSAHSAYACFLFSPLFFHQYHLASATEKGSEAIKCKLHMKSVLPLFRLPSIERNVEQCQISIDNDLVKIKFFCKHGIIKTHNLRFQESDALQVVFASHLCPNALKAPAKLLGDMVMHFPVSQEEITLSICPVKVSLRNYYEGGNDHMKMMHTEMSLHPDEFDYFQVGVESDITFCLKELRGLLSFAESHCLPVSVYFGAAGKPVCFSIEDMVLEATVVLATLLDSESIAPSQPTGTPLPTTASRAADGAVETTEPNILHPRDTLAVTEMIASSQGSPINPPPRLLLRPSQTELRSRQGEPSEVCAPAPSPAPPMICSLLFKALSSQTEDDSGSSPRVLVCFSDEEEEMEEDSRCPSL